VRSDWGVSPGVLGVWGAAPEERNLYSSIFCTNWSKVDREVGREGASAKRRMGERAKRPGRAMLPKDLEHHRRSRRCFDEEMLPGHSVRRAGCGLCGKPESAASGHDGSAAYWRNPLILIGKLAAS
jgi:hypothetical protein